MLQFTLQIIVLILVIAQERLYARGKCLVTVIIFHLTDGFIVYYYIYDLTAKKATGSF